MIAKIWVLVFLFLLIPQHDAWADRYVDQNGVVHMTDKMDKVPPDQRGRVRSRQAPVQVSQYRPPAPQVREAENRVVADLEQDGCEIQLKENARSCTDYLQNGATSTDKDFDPNTYLVAMGLLCAHPLLQDRFTAQEKEQVRKLVLQAKEAEKHLTKQRRYEAAMMATYFAPRCGQEEAKEAQKTYSRQELDTLGVELKAVWKDMSAAMAANNIEKAVSYYWVPMQDEWRRRIASFSNDQRTQLGRDFMTAELRINRVEGGRADCYLTIPRDGRRVSGQLIFLQGLDGEWLIQNY